MSEPMSRPLKVLLIEDSSSPPDTQKALEILREYTMVEVKTIHREHLDDGIDMVASGQVEAVLLDFDLIDGQGVAVLDRLREAAPDIPIIVLTAAEDERASLCTIQRGAQDCLVKEKTDAEQLCRSIRYAQERERVGEELVLGHSEMSYRRLVENLNEGVLATDEAGIIIYSNPRMAEILGSPVECLIGSPVSRFIDDPDGTSPSARDLITRPTDQKQECELRLIRSDGRQVHALVVTSPIIDAAGTTFRGCLAGVLDITDRKKAELALRQSEQKYRLVVESLSEGIWVIDQDARTSYVNPRITEMLGYAPEEMLGESIHSFLSPADSAEMQARLERLRGGIREQYECEFIKKGGDRITTLLIASPFIDDSGEFRGSIAGVMDITERKRAEEEIKIRNRQLMVLNQVISVSATSLSLAELLEGSLEKMLELLGLHIGIVYMLDADRKQALLRYQKGVPPACTAPGRVIKVHHWPFNYTFIAGQPRYIEQQPDLNTIEAGMLRELGVSTLACIPLIAESVVVGAIYVGSRTKESFSRDERVLLETIGKEIGSGILKAMLHKRLEAANREANLYLDILTHDIKNAENVTGLYADLLIEMLEGEAAVYARKIQNSVRKSAEILGNVTTIRRIHHEPPDIRPVDLNAVIRKVISIFSDVAIEFEDTSCQVQADALLPEIFANLIRNAVKRGGPEVRMIIRVEDYDDDESVLVSVEDTGPGIPDLMKEAIFQRFERGWSGGHGNELGLFIVRTLIERYGGSLRVEDRIEGRPDLGVAFRFTLRAVLPPEDEDGDGE